jgi:hypothetical protein
MAHCPKPISLNPPKRALGRPGRGKMGAIYDSRVIINDLSIVGECHPTGYGWGMENCYDIIGDIHGHAAALRKLLRNLGYREGANGITPPEGRKVIFLGDYIDRGPQIVATLEIVRGMVESGNALAILGNHEINALRFHAHDSNGTPLRAHSPKNIRQHERTLEEFSSRCDLKEWLDWLAGLPLCVDLGGLRAVHACWHAESLASLSSVASWSGAALETHSRKGSVGYATLSRVVNGPEAILPDGHTHRTADGTHRRDIRVKWWERAQGQTCRTWIFPESREAPDLPPLECPETGYPEGSPPTFFGHYAILNGRPAAIRADLACLDFGAGKGGKIAAYRWDRERGISDNKFFSEDTQWRPKHWKADIWRWWMTTSTTWMKTNATARGCFPPMKSLLALQIAS